MENSAETTTQDDGELANYPAGPNWNTPNGNNPNSTLLFIAVEYVKDTPSDFKFEPDSNFSPQPPAYSEFEQHVSPLDPNMSSTAQYSPVYSDSTETTYNNSVVVLPDGVNPILSQEINQNSNSSFMTTNPAPNYHLTNPNSPLDALESPLSNSETQLLRQVENHRYLLQNGGGGAGADREIIDFNNHRSDGQIEKDLQLVQYPINSYQSIIERNMKVDPDQVELLITDHNTGISYSGFVSQDFLVGRNGLPLPPIPEDEQQLNTVLNTLESHGLVMEAASDCDNDPSGAATLNPPNSCLSLPAQQMMIQDPLLDPELLLQAPVEILDDQVLTNPLVLKSELSSQLLPYSPSNPDLLSRSKSVYIKDEFGPDYQLRRSRRQNDKLSDDLELLQSISDKPVPSRARATLPASYLVINKLPSSNVEAEAVYGVFARKAIPKRTQFGPLEGVLVTKFNNLKTIEKEEEAEEGDDGLKLLLEFETGAMHRLDISDENTSNWMRYVRQAKSYQDQNLVLSQQGHSLYYTTTRAILPRQELQVGYSDLYASKRKLNPLVPTEDEDQPWACFECPQKFPTSADLQKHLNIHDDNNKEVESSAAAAAAAASKAKQKKLNRFKRRPIDCPHCPRTFLRRHSLTRHLLQHSNPSLYKERTVRPVVSRPNSETTNDKTLEWKCDGCCLSFPNPTLLNLHELVHKETQEKPLTGLPADLGSGCNEGEFLVHNGAVQCPQCGIEFASRNLLIEHVAAHGVKTPEIKARPVQKNTFKCYMCYKAFAARDRLQRHMLVHGSEESKPLKCDVCTKRFLNNSALQCHLKTHKVDKKIFECPICKKTFEQVLMLREHVKFHCVNGIYTCPHCNKNFKEYSVIRKHIRAFHCDRKHGCQYCGKPFPTLDKLRMHLLKHSDHREFLCSECGKQFKRKDKLKEHMKRMHAVDRELKYAQPKIIKVSATKKFMPKVQPTDYHRFIYKCHKCMLGFKRRGMLVNHLAKRHPDISPDSVPELNLPILKTTRDYYCQYCEKVYKSSSKRKAHILKNHPGFELPMSNRRKGGIPDIPGLPNPTFSQTVGSVTTNPHGCQWCHKQYASKAKLLQHQRKKHQEMVPSPQKVKRVHGQEVEQPQSPDIPEDGKFMNSPDIPDSAVGSTGLPDENMPPITDTQLEVLGSNTFTPEDDSRQTDPLEDPLTLKQSYKLADTSLLPENYNECRPNSAQFYRIIEMPMQSSSGDESIIPQEEPSRLYRLLTASNNGPFPPYPPR